MEIKIYICEDAVEQRQFMEKAVTSYLLFSNFPMKLAASSGSADELLGLIDRKNQTNVYFLDVSLNEEDEIKNGFVLAQEIRKFDPFGFIIFITVRSELSFLTFQYKVAALDFIIKSYETDISIRVKECLDTICSRLEKIQRGEIRSIKLNIGTEITSFFVSDIRYFESNKNHIITVYTGNEEYSVHQNTLGNLEEELGGAFVRCHRSFLVNSQWIDTIELDYSSLYIDDGTEIPISARKRKLVKEKMKAEGKEEFQML